MNWSVQEQPLSIMPFKVKDLNKTCPLWKHFRAGSELPKGTSFEMPFWFRVHIPYLYPQVNYLEKEREPSDIGVGWRIRNCTKPPLGIEVVLRDNNHGSENSTNFVWNITVVIKRLITMVLKIQLTEFDI